jgi:hypothetical protein
MPCDTHPLATEPGSPVRFTFPAYPSPDSNRERCGSEPQASTVGLEGHESDRPDSNRPYDLGKVRCFPLTLRSHGACPENRTPTASVPGRHAAVITKQAWLGAQVSNLKTPGSKPGGSAEFPHHPSRAAPRCRPESPALQERGRSRARRRSVPGAIRTRTAVHLKDVPPAIGLRGHRSRHPVPTRTTGLTRAGPQAVRGGEAGHPGFEPGSSGFRVRRVCLFP